MKVIIIIIIIISHMQDFGIYNHLIRLLHVATSAISAGLGKRNMSKNMFIFMLVVGINSTCVRFSFALWTCCHASFHYNIMSLRFRKQLEIESGSNEYIPVI